MSSTRSVIKPITITTTMTITVTITGQQVEEERIVHGTGEVQHPRVCSNALLLSR